MGTITKRRELNRKKERKTLLRNCLFLAFVVFLFTILLVAAIVSEDIDIKDKALKKAVKKKIGLRTITQASLLDIVKLNVSGRGIESLEGIEKLENIKKLNLTGNNISDLKPLAGLKHLKELDLSYSNITNLDGLENLESLEKLNLEGNGVKDLNPLKNLTNLKTLNLNHNNIISLQQSSIQQFGGGGVIP